MTAVTATLTWRSGRDGGHPQTFSVLLRTPSSAAFSPSEPRISVSDPGLGKLVYHTVTSLEPETWYRFLIRSTNKKAHTDSTMENFITLGMSREICTHFMGKWN